MMTQNHTRLLLTRVEVEHTVRLSTSAINRLMRAGKFPLPIRIRENTVKCKANDENFDSRRADPKHFVMNLWTRNSWPMTDDQYNGLTEHLRRNQFTVGDLENAVVQYVDNGGSRPPRFGDLVDFMREEKRIRRQLEADKPEKLQLMISEEAKKGWRKSPKLKHYSKMIKIGITMTMQLSAYVRLERSRDAVSGSAKSGNPASLPSQYKQIKSAIFTNSGLRD